MSSQDLVPHLFRTEYSNIVGVLIKHFGLENIDVAEDIASETFLAALESWRFNGLPNAPTAWLYTVAKNKARNHLVRAKIMYETSPDVLEKIATTIDLSHENISDSQLRMIFVVCHPSIPLESQIGLALRILCGFGIGEIADAFLTTKDTINKRLFRAKEALRNNNVSLEVPGEEEMERRLTSVLTTIYLLFSEGYYSESQPEVLREDLCQESIRLTELLMGYEATCRPETLALLALTCFHSSRFLARRNESGEMVLYADQDESLWDQSLISRGVELLHQASTGHVLTKFHLEASIAYWHCQKEDTSEKWESVLYLHNLLLQIEYSPIAALNRTYALAKVKGNEVAIIEAEKLQLTTNQYYYMLLGELYKDTDPNQAKANLSMALSLAKTDFDKQTIKHKLDNLQVRKNQ